MNINAIDNIEIIIVNVKTSKISELSAKLSLRASVDEAVGAKGDGESGVNQDDDG